jgi:ATP synthase protein I
MLGKNLEKPEDIKLLEERIEKLERKEEIKKTSDNAFIHASKMGFRVGAELLSGVLVGAGIGYFLDKTLGTKPWFLVSLLLIGACAGFLNVYRFIKKEEEKKE